MGWVKLDDGFFLHPKAIAAGRDARDVFIAAVCWSSSRMTDGVIPAPTLVVIGALCGVVDVEQAASRLVDVGLWENHVDGWAIHDFLGWQQSREDREEWLKRDRERKRKARDAARDAALNASKRIEARENVRADSARNPSDVRAIEVEVEVDEKRSSSVSAPDFAPVAALGIGMTTTTTSDPRADRALRTYASRMATGKADPAAYRASIIRNGAEHLERINTLALTHPAADPDELADLYLTERRPPTKPAAPTTCHHCGGPRHASGPCPTLLANPEDAA